MSKKILVFFWGMFMVALGVLAFFFNGQSTHFFGIADDQEQTILTLSKKDSPIVFHDNRLEATSLEASGVLWDPNHFNYLLISDESRGRKPALYRMDEQGRITDQVVLQGAPKIDDLESISTDGPYTYLLASLSRNKKKKLNTKRRQFIRLGHENSSMPFRGSLDLYQILETLATTAEDSRTAQFLQDALQSQKMDIEGHAVRNGDAFLGFKAPRDAHGQTVILRITDVDSLFQGHKPRGEIWQTVTLVDSQTGERALLSDMLWVEDTLLLLGIRGDKQNPVSHVWAYDHTRNLLRELATIPNLRVEGISRTRDPHVYMLVSDGRGKTASRYLTVNLESSIRKAGKT